MQLVKKNHSEKRAHGEMQKMANYKGNPIAQGSVDSTVSFKLEVGPDSASTLYYWIACGKNLEEVKKIDSIVRETGVEQMLLETENYWSAWSRKKSSGFTVLPRDISRLFKQSLLIMRSHVDNEVASFHLAIPTCFSSTVTHILMFGHGTEQWSQWLLTWLVFLRSQECFSAFVTKTLDQHGYFNHKYSSDGSIGSSWHPLIDPTGKIQLPIQEDETALVLLALFKHFERYGDLEFISKVYPKLVLNTSEFLLSHRDTATGLPKPSFGIWEEKFGVFSATVSTVISALQSAAAFAKVFYDSERQEKLTEAATEMKKAMLTNLYDAKAQRFKKAIYPTGINDLTVDSSISLSFITGAFSASSEEVKNSMNSISDKLWIKTNIGGIARYENDNYQRVTREVPGNPWFICTLWLARWYIATALSSEDLDRGLNLLKWTAKNASPSGLLAEQINPNNGNPISVAPLVWSHAEFVMAVCEYVEKQKELSLLNSGK